MTVFEEVEKLCFEFVTEEKKELTDIYLSPWDMAAFKCDPIIISQLFSLKELIDRKKEEPDLQYFWRGVNIRVNPELMKSNISIKYRFTICGDNSSCLGDGPIDVIEMRKIETDSK